MSSSNKRFAQAIAVVGLRIPLITLLSVVALTAPISAMAAEASTTTAATTTVANTVTSPSTLLFVGNQNRAPIIFLSGEEPAGIAVDLVREISKHISKPIDIKVMDWTAAQASLTAGTADALVYINPTEERKAIYDFSDPLLDSQLSIFTRTETVGITEVPNLHGLRVGVEAESLPQRILAEHPEIKVLTYPNIVSGFNQLSTGSLDAVIVDYRLGAYVLAQNNIRNIKVSGNPIEAVHPTFAVKKGNAELLNEINAALMTIKADGTYQRVLDDWKSVDVVFQTQEQIIHEIYNVAIGVLLLFLLVAAAWSISIRRELSKRKKAEIEALQADEALKKTAANLNEAQQMVHIGSWELDLVTNVLTWSDEIYRMFEIDPKKFGATYEAFLNAIHPDDRDIVNKAYTESVATHTPYGVDHRLLMKDGRIKYVHERSETFYDKNGKPIRSVGTVQDITERKTVEEALRIANAYNRSLIEASLDPLVTISPEGKITDVNDATEVITGYSQEELIGKDFSDYFTDPEKARAGYRKVFETGKVNDYALGVKHKDGHVTPVLYNASVYKDEIGNVIGVFAAARDITESKKAEEKLNATNQALRMLSTTNEALIHAVSEEELHQKVCDIMVKEGGYRMTWIGHIEHDGENTIHAEAHSGFDEGYVGSINIKWPKGEEGCGPECTAIKIKQPVIVNNIATDPTMIPWRDAALERGYRSMTALPLTSNGVAFAVLSVYSASVNAFSESVVRILKEMTEDLAFGITALRVREELRKTEERFQQSMETARDAIIIMGADQRITYWNKASEQIFGYTSKEVLGQQVHALLVAHSEDREKFASKFPHFQETGEGPIIGQVRELTALRKNGEMFPIELSVSAANIDGKWYSTGIIRDITERKKAELELSETNRNLRIISAVNEAIVHATDEQAILREASEIIATKGGYNLTWIGYVEYDEEKSIRPIAQSGFDEGYLESLKLTWSDNERGRGPGGTAIRTKQSVIIRDIETDSRMAPWRDAALERGYRSVMALPLMSNGDDVFAVMLVYAPSADAFSEATIHTLEETASDLSFCVKSIRTRKERDQVERYAEKLVSSANAMIISLDLDGNVLVFNDAAEEITGYNKSEVLGRNWFDLIVPQNRYPEAWKTFSETLDQKKAIAGNFQSPILTKGGEERMIEWRNSDLHDDGNVLGTISYGIDITEREKAERALQDERGLFVGGPTIVFKWKAEEGLPVEYVSPNIREQFGYAPEEFTNGKILYASIIHPEDTARVHAEIAAYSTQGVGSFEQTYRVARTDGRYRWVYVFTKIIKGQNSETIGYLGYVMDTTARKKAEDELEEREEELKKANEFLIDKQREVEEEKTKDEALLDSLGEGIIAVDKQGKVVAINHAGELLLGWGEEEILGKSIVEVLPVLDDNGKTVPPEKRVILAAIATKTTTTSDIRYVRKDGSVLPVSVTATPFILNGETVGAVNVFRDTTKERELEETRRDLLSLASHQLRTPLSGTKWLIETLQKGIHGPLNKEQKEYLDEIYRINERMTNLVFEMLGVLRSESGVLPVASEPVSTTKIMNDVFDHLGSSAKEKDVKLVLADSPDVTIQTDPHLLQNALESIVSNAIIYSRPNSEVVVHVEDTPNELVFNVQDSGIGIPKEEQGHIFERFYRASNAKTYNTRGTGLGLTLASILSSKIRGRISFVSEAGKGSTFSLHISH